MKNTLILFFTFLRLGCTAFGGPVAHIAYFRAEFVERLKWFSDSQYSQLVAICQFLPGPASSQVGIAIGMSRGGQLGAFAAWLGFTMPSAIILIIFASSLSLIPSVELNSIIHGLKLITVAVVFQAVYMMAKQFDKGLITRVLAIVSAIIIGFSQILWLQFAIIIVAGLVTCWFMKSNALPQDPLNITVSDKAASNSFNLLVLGLVGLPLLVWFSPVNWLMLVDSFFRVGAIVFGGGHVVLPMLQQELVTPGWVNANNFVAGYGATQSVPGPIFTFAAFLGAVNQLGVPPIAGAFICLFAIFIPSFLMVNTSLYYWQKWQHMTWMANALIGINAAVVGLLAACLINPVVTQSIFSWLDGLVCLALIAILFSKKCPVWLLVILVTSSYWLVALFDISALI
ncbi:chromate efflux transporter [Catenovulum maritimum]|uniref:Chromate transporter n=1 Tax=Catenovulum maritimum TaxID=1513271 RepID=A0A0J8GUJ8_9ALTE|nr:chromate efflux transporter [Catenovulum maritimum]KMT64974.1 hypothetical protein XM47_10810 [Catenovulum maritimum]